MSAVMEAMREIDLARDFSATPIGRTRRQGRHSGEAFREDVLRPALKSGDQIVVDLDGAHGLSTGFLDEGFAGLVRDNTLTPKQFWDRIHIVCTRDPYILDEIRRFVSRAAAQA